MLTLKELFSEQEIHDRISALGKEISQVYKDEPLVIICVLKGAFLFFSDLVRNIQKESQLELDFVRPSAVFIVEKRFVNLNDNKTKITHNTDRQQYSILGCIQFFFLRLFMMTS